jgi:hypothetical protein
MASSITLPARRCKAEDRESPGDGEDARRGADPGLAQPDHRLRAGGAVEWLRALNEAMLYAGRTGVGSALTAYDMPVEGRDEWLAAVRRLA